MKRKKRADVEKRYYELCQWKEQLLESIPPHGLRIKNKTSAFLKESLPHTYRTLLKSLAYLVLCEISKRHWFLALCAK